MTRQLENRCGQVASDVDCSVEEEETQTGSAMAAIVGIGWRVVQGGPV